MPGLEICRICLGTKVKLYRYDDYELKKYYERIMVTKMDDREGLPHHFCYECAAMLHKFHKFKEKCYTGQTVLRELMCKGPITIKSIRHIDRQSKNLQSSLNVISVNHRVRTYIIKSKEKPKVIKTEEREINEIETVSSTDDGDNDDYIDEFDDNDERPLLPELVDVDEKIEVDEMDIGKEESIIEEHELPSIDNDDYIGQFDNNDELPLLPELEDVDEKIEIDEMDIDKEEITIEEHELPSIENESDVENNLSDDDYKPLKNDEDVDKLLKNDDDDDDDKPLKVTNDFKAVTENDKRILIDDIESEKQKKELRVEKKKKTKGTKKKKSEKEFKKVDNKAKKFEITDKKKTELDPKNWLKFNLSEEEAVEEFKSRAQHKRFISAKYKCNDCLKGFSKEDMLNRHVKLRHSESVGPIECRFCSMRFKWKCFLRKHMRQHYTKYKCLRCDLVCPLETTALFHEEYHNGVIRKCAHCGDEFKHLTTYYTHLRTHRSEHVCTLCGASFVSAIGLRIHKKIKHINAESKIVSNEGAEGEDEYCKRCDIRFETKKAYEEHLIHSAMHVDGIEDWEVQAPLGSTRNPKKRRQKPKRLTRIPTDCHICGKHFSTQAACRKHHLAEHPRTSFFAPNERHICEICGISLAPGSVSSHLNTHTREKLYPCNTCGRQFNSKGGLNTHQLTHTSEKPVPCTLCDKRFKQISSMKLHYRTFHLKEPYPKRNRKRKIDEITKLDDFPHEESDDNMTLDKWR